MENNDFLLYNEIVYRIHACQTLEELKHTILTQVKLLIPCTYASIVAVGLNPDEEELIHSDPYCLPKSFAQVEQSWIDQVDRSFTLWLSHAPESVVIRDSELLAGEARFSAHSYKNFYLQCGVSDSMQLNIVYNRQSMARLALYRVQQEGDFTDRDAFFLRALSNHINLAYYQALHRHPSTAINHSPQELAEKFNLTRREQEVLSLVFQDLNNEEILDRLSISKYTLLKHLQNLYRKCDVSSRLELLKLRI